MNRILSILLAVITICGLQASGQELAAGLKEAIRSLQAAEPMPGPECRTILNRMLPLDYIHVAPDGKMISRSEVVGAQSPLCSGKASTIEDERIHLYRDE